MSTSHEVFTTRIIALMEQGTVPWHRPWHEGAGTPLKLGSGKPEPYRGANVWMLRAQGYSSPWWGTFAQMQARGGRVNKGEHATPVVFGKTYRTKEDTTAFVLKHYLVFNVEQCTGVEVPAVPGITTDHTPLEHCDKLIGNYPNGPVVLHGGSRACYIPSRDVVEMPPMSHFPVLERYYSTLFHELTHSTGHVDRLRRRSLTEMVPFGTPKYAKEELIAEMGAALLCGMAGIENTTIDQSAAYLKSWLAVLRGNMRLLVEAGSAAQKAVDYITGHK